MANDLAPTLKRCDCLVSINLGNSLWKVAVRGKLTKTVTLITIPWPGQRIMYYFSSLEAENRGCIIY